MLSHNISNGVIISNHSLVLQGVSRQTAGNVNTTLFRNEINSLIGNTHKQ